MSALFGAADGDLMIFIADAPAKTNEILGELRLRFARWSGIMDKVKDQVDLLWVTDFPLLEYRC